MRKQTRFIMSKFERTTLGIFISAILMLVMVLRDATFNVGVTPIVAIAFFLASLFAVYWVFYTKSGKTYARKYNKEEEERIKVNRLYSRAKRNLSAKKYIRFFTQKSH